MLSGPLRASWLLFLVPALLAGGCFLDRSGTRTGASDAGPGLDGGGDASARDASLGPDAGTPDSGTPDAGTPDAGTPDASTPDASTPDAGTPDASTPDAGTPDAGPVSCLARYGGIAGYFACGETASECEFFGSVGSCGTACTGAGGTCVNGFPATNPTGGRCNRAGLSIGCGPTAGSLSGVICTCSR